MIFGIESATSGYHGLEAPVSTYFATIASGDAQDVVSMHNIRTTDQADYWIFMAALLWPTTLILMKTTYKKPVRPRSVNKFKGLGRQQVRGLLLISLVLSAHGLSIYQRTAQFSFRVELEHSAFMEKTVNAQDLYVRDPFAHLAPPGNPVQRFLQLTPTGISMMQTICDRLISQSKPQTINLHKALGLDAARQTVALADTFTEDVCTVRADRPVSPILPIAATQTVDEPISFQIDDTPEPKGVASESFHLPDRDPSYHEFSSCRFPFRDRDTEDLLEEWPILPFVDLPQAPDYITEVLKVLELPFVHADDDKDLYVYTDGSYDKKTQESSWAFVVFAVHQHQVTVRDWFADFVVYESMDPLWIGATQVGIRSAEATALIFAILYTMQRYQADNIKIFSDALSLVQSTMGQWTIQDGDHIGLNLRATFLAAKTLRKHQLFQILHVRSHFGIVGNEFADFLAVGVREKRIPPRGIPRSFEFWFQGINPHKKYVNIPSEKYIYVHIYVCICVYTYLCKMDERRSYASLS